MWRAQLAQVFFFFFFFKSLHEVHKSHHGENCSMKETISSAWHSALLWVMSCDSRQAHSVGSCNVKVMVWQQGQRPSLWAAPGGCEMALGTPCDRLSKSKYAVRWTRAVKLNLEDGAGWKHCSSPSATLKSLPCRFASRHSVIQGLQHLKCQWKGW